MLFNNVPLALNRLKCLGEQPMQKSSALWASPRVEQICWNVTSENTGRHIFPSKGWGHSTGHKQLSLYYSAPMLPNPKVPELRGGGGTSEMVLTGPMPRQARIRSGLCGGILCGCFALLFTTGQNLEIFNLSVLIGRCAGVYLERGFQTHATVWHHSISSKVGGGCFKCYF